MPEDAEANKTEHEQAQSEPQITGFADERSKQIYNEVMQRNKAYQEHRRQELRRVKAANQEKEPFDILAFSKLYDISDDWGKVNITPALIEWYEMEYYLDHPEMQTLRAFAEYRNWLDINGWS